MLRRLHLVTALAVCLGACARDTTLPPPPVPPKVPAIAGFTPHAAFSGDVVVVWGENLAESGNQLVFPGGLSALAETGDEGDLRVDGGVAFVVPQGLFDTGPLVLSNTQGNSEPSADTFAPLGVGHPNLGTPVSTLRFRHDPVGLVDRLDNVLMASSIFDLLVTDGKAFGSVPGRPIAMKATVSADQPFVSVRTPAGGKLLQVSADDGRVLLESAESDTRELFILPPAVVGTLARTVGRDLRGRTWLSEWREQSRTLVAARRELPLVEAVGAAAEAERVYVAGRSENPLDPPGSLYQVTPTGVARVWAPMTGSGCSSTDAACAPLDGPLAVVPTPALADGGLPAPTVAASLATGDLLLVAADTEAHRVVRLISYAPIDDLAPGVAAGKLLLTKAQDGALFQYDLETEELDWSVQLRGAPSVMHVAADIDEIAVGNRADNAVDIITASTGAWVGRIAFDLGLGSAGGREGGIVAPYSYDPARAAPGADVKERMDLLLRNVGLVASIDASSLEVFDHVGLVKEVEAGAPLRLFVTSGLETVVVHERRLGLLEATGEGLARRERLLTPQDLPLPLDIAELPSTELVVSTPGAIQVYRWLGSGANRALAFARELPLPAGARWLATRPAGDELLVLWTTPATGFGGGLYDARTLAAGVAPRVPLALRQGLADYAGAVALRDGPALLFGRSSSGGPAAVTAAQLRANDDPLPSVVSRPRMAGASPDGRFLVWLDEGAEEPLARLVSAGEGAAFEAYSSYRLSGPAAGPGFDPSGEWFFLPVPRHDELVVVQ